MFCSWLYIPLCYSHSISFAICRSLRGFCFVIASRSVCVRVYGYKYYNICVYWLHYSGYCSVYNVFIFEWRECARAYTRFSRAFNISSVFGHHCFGKKIVCAWERGRERASESESERANSCTNSLTNTIMMVHESFSRWEWQIFTAEPEWKKCVFCKTDRNQKRNQQRNRNFPSPCQKTATFPWIIRKSNLNWQIEQFYVIRPFRFLLLSMPKKFHLKFIAVMFAFLSLFAHNVISLHIYPTSIQFQNITSKQMLKFNKNLIAKNNNKRLIQNYLDWTLSNSLFSIGFVDFSKSRIFSTRKQVFSSFVVFFRGWKKTRTQIHCSVEQLVRKTVVYWIMLSNFVCLVYFINKTLGRTLQMCACVWACLYYSAYISMTEVARVLARVYVCVCMLLALTFTFVCDYCYYILFHVHAMPSASFRFILLRTHALTHIRTFTIVCVTGSVFWYTVFGF